MCLRGSAGLFVATKLLTFSDSTYCEKHYCNFRYHFRQKNVVILRIKLFHLYALSLMSYYHLKWTRLLPFVSQHATVKVCSFNSYIEVPAYKYLEAAKCAIII